MESHLLNSSSGKYKGLLVIIPLMVLVLCIMVVIERSPFYSSWSDPIYCYLINGLNIAHGHFHVGHVDHPGTPLQLYTGALIKLFHLFRQDNSTIHDVLANPEWYLLRICVTNSFIISLCLYIAGRCMFTYTGNIFYALFVQLVHIISFTATFYSQNLMVEFILVACGILLAPLLVEYTFHEKKDSDKIIVVSGLIIGVMLAGKFSSAPIFLLWVMIAKSRKHLLMFTGIAAASFVLTTIPAWYAAKKFALWVTNMLIHEGSYGQGTSGFADWPSFFNHLGDIFSFSYIFTIGYLVITITVVIYFRKIFSKERSSALVRARRTMAAIWFAITLQAVMVAKQFSMHYFIPANLLIIPGVIVTMSMHSEKKFIKFFTTRPIVSGMVVLSVAGFLIVHSALQYQFFPHFESPAREMNKQMVDKRSDIILFDNRVTGPMPQPALWFGSEYAGDRKDYYKRLMQEMYPHFYRYDISNHMFKDWYGDVDPQKVLRDSMVILYYHGTPDAFNVNQSQWPDSGYAIDTVLFSYTNPIVKESVYLLRLKAE
jgi:hypothetical protein